MAIILASFALVVAQGAVPDTIVELRGHIVWGGGAVISIPELRTGTVANEGGAFKLRFHPRARCYELFITSVTMERRVWRFEPPRAGRLNLGDITLPKRPRYTIWPDHLPLLADTVGDCVATKGPWPDRWPAGHARVAGTVSRGARPLRGALIDVACSYANAYTRVTTDSAGAFAADLAIAFPDDQVLAGDGRAACEVRHAAVAIDPPWPVSIQFVPLAQQAIVQNVKWTLPEPDFKASRIVAPGGDVMHPTYLGNVAAFDPGVLPHSQLVAIALFPRPAAPTLYRKFECLLLPNGDPTWDLTGCRMTMESPDTGFRRYLLPLALSVSTGTKLPTTGSAIYLNVPAAVGEAIDAGGILEVYSRVPLRYTADSTAYVRNGVSYNRALQLLQFGFPNWAYDDERSPRHEYEAFFLLAVRPKGVGPSAP